MFNRFYKIAVLSLFCFILPTLALAQITGFGYTNELGVEVIPTYPRPNSTVTINISLYTGDLNSAQIDWFQNGKLIQSGTGKTQYSFNTGRAGEEISIRVEATLLDGSFVFKEIDMNPAEVDVIWEANSYVPPFYKGKALHSRQGSLKVVAMPNFVKNGRAVSPENLIYEWSNGINVLQNKSGYGKNAISINGALLGTTEEIEVLVTDPVNNLAAKGFVNITPGDPKIVFYQNDPYYGYIFDNALSGTFSLKSDEVQILAAPYYFTKEIAGLIKYDWQLNGESIYGLSDSRTAIFRKPENQTGQSLIFLRMENQNRILQQAENNLIMDFSK